MAATMGTSSQALRRGTTPTLVLRVAGADLTDAGEWPVVWLTVRDVRGNHLYVGRDGLSIAPTDGGCEVTARLTQAQTLSLGGPHGGTEAMAQIRARAEDGTAIATDVAKLTVEATIMDGEV
jgi:hypothetical protein